MQTIRGTVKNGVIHPLESLNLVEGQSVLITVIDENREQVLTQSIPKLSKLLLLPELDDDELKNLLDKSFTLTDFSTD